MNNFQEKIKGLDELINNAINDEAFPGANYCLVTTDEVTFNSLGKKALVPNVEDNNIDSKKTLKYINQRNKLKKYIQRE